MRANGPKMFFFLGEASKIKNFLNIIYATAHAAWS